jgi:hypothetical protein
MKKPRKVTDTRKIISKDEKKSDNSSTLQVLSSELRKDTLFAPFVLEKLVENSTDDTFLVPNFSSKFLNDSSGDPFTVPVQLKKETYLAQELSLYRPLLVLEKSAEKSVETDDTFLLLILLSKSCHYLDPPPHLYLPHPALPPSAQLAWDFYSTPLYPPLAQ